PNQHLPHLHPLPPTSTLFPYTTLFRSAPHDHRRRRRRIGPAEIGADFDILDLAAAALAVVVGVLALAVRPDRAGIIDIAAQLPRDRKSTRLNSSHRTSSYAVFCLKKNK